MHQLSQQENRPGRVVVTASPEQVPIAEVETQLCTLAGQIAAATARFLELLAEFDRRRGWQLPGVVSCVHWLTWRCALDERTAREYLRVARAVHGDGGEPVLPSVRENFAAGRLSYSKVRAITRVATPLSEGELVDAALHSTAAQVERLARGLRKVAVLDRDVAQGRAGEAAVIGNPGVRVPAPRESGPSLQWRWNDEGELVVWGRLDAAGGAAFLAATARAQAELLHVAGDGSAEPSPPAASVSELTGRAPADLAPAVVAMAETVLAAPEAPRFAPAAQVVVLAPLDELRTALTDREVRQEPMVGGDRPASPSALPRPTPDPARFCDGPPVGPALLRQLIDDGALRTAVLAGDGRTLDLGRSRRRPTSRQLAVLWTRDGGCRAPGCRRDRFLHAHHVVHWGRGGGTTVDNLVLLCGEHHRLLHEGAFTILAQGRQRFAFAWPDGTAWEPAPPLSGDLADVPRQYAHVGSDAVTGRWDGAPLSEAAVADFLARWYDDRQMW
ncbi:HNH endonuclease [Spongisporangium articulatum]|uniref:HNH endonuclease n=1 Tax=Spongisporangium articulatum TaxID=3362603 RepID=A0ABW8ASP6_9ACTN